MEGKKDGHNSSLNVERIKLLITQGFNALPLDRKIKNSVLVIGDTGVGKSTILSYLSGAKLMVKANGVNTVLDVEDKNHLLKIGHDRYSETRVPSKMVIKGTAYFDCSGFKDNRGDDYEISNSFFLQRLFKIYSNVKILLVIDENYISQARIDKLPKLIKNLAASFGDLKSIEEGVILLINKAKPAYSQKDYNAQILKMAQLKTDKFIFSDSERNFIDFLVKNNKVCLFKQPEAAQNGNPYESKDDKILETIGNSKFVSIKTIKNIISESTKLSIKEYLDQLTEHSEEKFDPFAKRVIKDCLAPKDATMLRNLKEFKEKQEFLEKVKEYIKASTSENLCELLMTNLPSINFEEIEKDIEAISFFKEIYDKTGNYFTILKHKLVSEFTEAISLLKKDIQVLQVEEEEKEKMRQKCAELERHEAQLKRKLEIWEETMKNQAKEGEVKQRDFKKKEEMYLAKIDAVKSENESKFTELENNQLKYQEELEKSLIVLKEREAITNNCKSMESEIALLVQKMTDLQLSCLEKDEELELLKMENDTLKEEIEHLSQVSDKNSIAPSMMSLASKTSKYPDVHCPHFKNGGKCKHCIKAWKDSTKAANSKGNAEMAEKEETKSFANSQDFEFD